MIHLAVPSAAPSKSIDYTPDITSDPYWDNHKIGIVRITRIERDEHGRSLLTYTVTRQISSSPIANNKTVRSSDLWFGMHVDEPRLAVNQELLLYEAMQGNDPIVASCLDDTNREQVAALLAIARLRADRGVTQSVLDSCFDGNEVTAQYSLRRLLGDFPFRAPAGYEARLLQLRDQPRRSAQTRLLADTLLEKLRGRPEASDAEYSWLKDAIIHTPAADWTALKPFVDRIVQFDQKRQETISFLTGIVRQQNAPLELRIAAYSTFDDPRMFHFDAPDPPSDLLFETSIRMLNDSDPTIRRAGAALLYNIAVRVALPHRSEYIQHAMQAIEAKRGGEADPTTRSQFEHFLNLLRKVSSAQ